MSLTAHVDPAIELIARRFRNAPGPSGLAYLQSHAYFNQLAPADACLDSLLSYELDPSAGRPAGSDGDGDGSLGEIIEPGDEFAFPLRRAVATVVASGYLTMLSVEDPPGFDWVKSRDPSPCGDSGSATCAPPRRWRSESPPGSRTPSDGMAVPTWRRKSAGSG